MTGKKLGFRLVVLKVTKVISQWQGFLLKINYGLFRVLGLKHANKSLCNTDFPKTKLHTPLSEAVVGLKSNSLILRINSEAEPFLKGVP